MSDSKKITGSLSDAVNNAIREHATRYSDQEITDALNKSKAFKKHGVKANARLICVRRIQVLGLGRGGKQIKKSNKRPPLVIELDVNEKAMQGSNALLGIVRWVGEAVASTMSGKAPPKDIDSLQKVLYGLLPDHLKAKKDEITKELLYDQLYDFYFKGDDRAQLLSAAHKANVSAEQLHENLQAFRTRVPPLWVVIKKLKDMHGRTHAPREVSDQALPGILRIERDMPASKLRDIPDTSYEKPFHALRESTKDVFDVGVISAPRIGLPYDVDIWNNLLRCGLSTAAKRKCDALVLGGGLFEMVLKKSAGHNRLLTDIVLAHKEFDPETVAECYRPEVKRILESGSLEPIYVTAAEKFAELLRGWFKVGITPGGKPEYDGPVYIVLGPDDHEIIRKMADADFNYQQKQKHAKAEAENRYQAKLLVLGEKEFREAETEGDTRRMNAAKDNITKIQKDMARTTDLVNRTYKTNFSETMNAKAVKYYTGLFVAKVEEKIPNALVVDLNDAHIRFGKSKHVFKFACPTGVSSFEAAVRNHGAVQRAGHLPDVTVLMSSSATHYCETSVQNYSDGKMFGEGSFVGAPVLIDQVPILERARGNKVPLAASKTVADSAYSGGMLILSSRPERRVGTQFLSAEMVREIGKTKTPKAPSKMLWVKLATDAHIGGAMRFRIHRPDGTIIGVTEASLEMLQRSGIDKSGAAHVHMYAICDDILNGNHFGTERSPHYNEESNASLMWKVHERQKMAEELRRLKDLRTHDSETVKLLTAQLAIRVSHTLTGQLQELVDGVLNPYSDVFKGILLRAKQSNVVVRGVSHYTGMPDKRDVGILNLGSGNHAGKTTDYMWHEGPTVAEHFRQRFHSDPDLKGLDLNKMICAPVSQRVSFGYGTLCVDGKFTYGVHIASTPPKRTGWADIVKGWLSTNRGRGNPSTILDKMPIIHLTGDKHFFGINFAGGDIYAMGPASTHTDEFAEMAGGLRENNTGVAFIGIPIEGPDHGAIQAVHLTPREIQDYISHPDRKVPWGDICPNPA